MTDRAVVLRTYGSSGCSSHHQPSMSELLNYTTPTNKKDKVIVLHKGKPQQSKAYHARLTMAQFVRSDKEMLGHDPDKQISS